uniref:Uncharacterized protein n=1 Tax=Oryza glumipatula TaxID=40148 RepID=A0A0D9ZBU5_9ORYZ
MTPTTWSEDAAAKEDEAFEEMSSLIPLANYSITVADFLTHYDDKGLDGCPAMHHLSLPAASLD